MSRHILPLHEVNDEDSGLVGGKAANLAKLVQHGVAVPKGVVIALGAFTAAGKLKASAKEQLASHVRAKGQYAVRSSALAEDAEDASWAGQFETFLYVQGGDVAAKAEACHGAVTARARAYDEQNSNARSFQIAVVVQEMVDPAYAGVLFTRDPVTGKNQFVGEYVSGVGEQLVSGKVTPKSFTWDPDTEKQATDEPLPFDVESLLEEAGVIEAIFNMTPQDIEWAIDRQGKLWIVQSRPITTLDVEHVGEGRHYLGRPGNLFYWGPANARPLYMSDFLVALQEQYGIWNRDPDFPDPPKTLALFHDDKMLWLFKREAFASFTEEIFKAYYQKGNLAEDWAGWKASIAAIDYSTSYSPQALLKLLKTSWRYTLSPEFALYGAEGVITKELSRFGEADRHRIWGAFSLPDEPTFINKIDQDVVNVRDPRRLAEQYPWALNSYAGAAKKSSLIKYFTQRISDLEGNDQLVLGTPDERVRIARTFELSEDLQGQLNMAREIAQFMDERKAWMMQSRLAILRMVEEAAEQSVRPKLLLERCLMADLAKADAAQYHGWTYIRGKGIDLTREDVDRSWDWYVEYKAATQLLQGIVSSRGGKHFMTGEVVVVHDPAAQVAPGKIVVVPSTGPSYVPIMRKAAALITDHGGMMSHAAIVAREFNLPCIVGTVHATKLLKDGDKVVLDLVRGTVSK